MSHLFSEGQLGELRLNNRIIIAPMCQYSAEQGAPTDWHSVHLGTLAQSGAGLLIIEATSVTPEGRISPWDLGIWSDELGDALQKEVEKIRHWSPIKLGIQLGHAGRKASVDAPWKGGKSLSDSDGGWETLAPSALAFGEYRTPRAMSSDDIAKIKQAFVDGARRAQKAGFDLIELHAAHGYLLHQFLSPLANQRTDNYGGSLENRLRLVVEIFEEVKAAVSLPVGVRISATDWVEGGWDIDSSIALAKALDARGSAYIHVSSGGLSPAQQIQIGPNYQVPFAQRIQQQVATPVIAVGLITEPEQAEAIIATGQAEFIALARAMLFNPRWPWHAAAKLGSKIAVAPQYQRSEPHHLRGLFSV